MCVPLVRRPRRGWVSREWGPLQGIRDEVLKQLRHGGKALIATDGGAMGDNHAERVGSIGVAVGGARAQGPLGGIDQTSYMAEVWALYKVMRSIAGIEGEIWVIIDNQSVQREADRWRTGTRKGVGNCPGIWWKIRDFMLKCPGIRFGWVPSHGKKQEEWEAPEGHNTVEWRALNDEADN